MKKTTQTTVDEINVLAGASFAGPRLRRTTPAMRVAA